MIINEDSRNQLMAKSKKGQRERDGKTRYEKRLKSKIASSTKQYNRTDMNSLFKQGILSVQIEIRGETDNYLVKISYGGFLEALQQELKRNNDQLELRNIIKALVISFNKEDVYISCTCPDWKYRFGYWATKNEITNAEPELRPSDETNPNDTLGSACKHVLLVLANASWIIKVASVIRNYINYIEKHDERAYAELIYPAIYNRKYEKPVQSTMFDKDELDTDIDTIDQANIDARKKGQFKAGNKYRYQKQDKPDDNQMTMFDDEEIDSEVEEEDEE